MLMGGKTKGNAGRERWLCEWIARALEKDGHNAEPIDLIDIAILSRGGCLKCVIEAKFLFCHDYYRGHEGHRFLKNVRADFGKRAYLCVPQQEIVLAASYQSMPRNAAALGLNNGKFLHSHLANHHRGQADGSECCSFERFENDLFKKFYSKCDIFPRLGKYQKKNTWEAKCKGAKALIRAWVLDVRAKNPN
jgi:hypothetical protein